LLSVGAVVTPSLTDEIAAMPADVSIRAERLREDTGGLSHRVRPILFTGKGHLGVQGGG